MTKEQALALASARLRMQQKQSGEADMRRMADPTAGTGFVQRFNEGMGKAFADLGRGAGQLVGMGPTAEETQETRRLDAPLMNTGAGMAGNVAGNIAALAPLAVVPGGATVAGAGAMGLLAGGLQPTEGAGERLINMGVGGVLGSGTQAVVGPLARKVGERAAAKEIALKNQRSQNAVRDETLRMGQESGYVVPPSAVNQPSFLGGRLESLGGKAALGQEASIRNQPVTDALAREAASIRPEQALNKANLRAARQELSAPYREVAALSPRAAADLEALQIARSESKLAWKEYNRQGVRTAYNDATKADSEVKRLTDNLIQEAKSAGKPELVSSLIDARKKLAQNHQVQGALNQGEGSVDASVIGRALDNGAPLDGPLETIGRYQQKFPHYMREATKVPSPGVGKTELLAAGLLAGSGYGATDSAGGAAVGLLPFLSGPARAALLSKAVQKQLAQPNYSAGLLTQKAAALNDPETQRRLALLARSLALPVIPQAVSE